MLLYKDYAATALIGLIFLGSCVLARKPVVFYMAQRYGTDGTHDGMAARAAAPAPASSSSAAIESSSITQNDMSRTHHASQAPARRVNGAFWGGRGLVMRRFRPDAGRH